MTAKKTAAKKAAVKKTAKGSTGVNKPGVIATIVDCISKERGSTVDETWAVLTRKFVDRDPDGMRKTELIQSNQQKTSKEAVDGRGTVFYKRR
jgi:hypothetical protein